MEITTRTGCKLACNYCPQKLYTKEYRKRENHCLDLEFNTFRTCLDKMPVDLEVFFAGYSEPWLNKNCTEMVLYASEKGRRVNIISTLVEMTPIDVEQLETANLESFAVHLPSQGEVWAKYVDNQYLDSLTALLKSGIDVQYRYHGDSLHPVLMDVMGDKSSSVSLCDRAGNIEVGGRAAFGRLKGKISCNRIYRNILLPNGDVVLCCMDYGMKHILGNLASGSYNSLFQGEEFKKIEQGMQDDSLDILCRTCDYADNADLTATLQNRYLRKLKRLFFR